MTFEDIKKKLKEIKEAGYIKTHRAGQTGIGKTLEDLLGIKENNIPGPNAAGMIELKSARKNVASMLTLFTKSPLPPRINTVILKRFGYPSQRGNDKKEIHTTVNAVSFNTIKRNVGFKIEIEKERINLILQDGEVIAYWDRELLKKAFEQKFHKLLYVKADVKGKGSNEEFWFNEAYLLWGFSFDNFTKLLKEGVIVIDIRIGQYSNGRTHDHGTAFRVFPDKLDLCFEHKERII